MRWLLATVLLALASLVHSLSLSLGEETNIVNDVGITSLLARRQDESDHFDLFVGTKRGTLLHFQYKDNDIDSLDEIRDEMTESKPIYSIASTTYGRLGAVDKDDATPFQLFCGGGDRYISVWQHEQTDKNWRCSQRLGPHTGWVKDVLFDKHSHSLHSIGCNCIESWKRKVIEGSTDLTWKHTAKRAIESSIEEGATLSSDLLCLCDSGEVDQHYSAGVDGRIHAWSSDVTLKDPLYSIAAHNGRVNVMVYSKPASLLFSSGHDGTVQCRRLEAGRPLNRVPDAQKDLLEASGDTARVTSLTLLQDTSEHVELVAGTATGELTCFEVVMKGDTLAIIDNADGRYRIAGDPVINALCVLKPSRASSSPWWLAVGHSLGLALITVERS